MKIKEVSSSFSMKKNLGNYQTADMWFSQTVEIDEKENEEEVAQKVYDFCKKMALKQYNEFDVKVEPKKTPEEEYATMPGFEDTKTKLDKITSIKKEFVKPWQKQIKDSMARAEADFKASGRVIDTNEPTYIAGERDVDGNATKILFTDEMKSQNTFSPL